MQFRLETYVENPTGLTDIQGVNFVVKVVRIQLAFSVYPLEAGYYRSSIIVPQPDTQEKIAVYRGLRASAFGLPWRAATVGLKIRLSDEGQLGKDTEFTLEKGDDTGMIGDKF